VFITQQQPLGISMCSIYYRTTKPRTNYRIQEAVMEPRHGQNEKDSVGWS